MTNYETIRSLLFTQHRLIDGCELLTGHESYGELLGLLSTAQGREFAAEHDFPDLETARALYTLNPKECERQGIYVDAGFIRLHNPEVKQITLVGKSFANIRLTDARPYCILALHEALVTVDASGYAVVRTAASSSSAIQSTVSEEAVLIED